MSDAAKKIIKGLIVDCHKTQRRDLEFVEKKGCITFSKVCVNLGKRANLETGREKYFCVRDFPENCARFGCPKLMPMSDPKRWQLRTLSERELKTLREFSDEVKRKKRRRRACM